MKPVRVVQGTAVPLDRSDVDTDQIIPAEWLKRVERTGFGQGLFATWRDDRDFVLNDERYAGANVLVAGPNFGTGSSREHAVWAIMDYGFEAVDQPPLRRHLPQQLHQERPRPGAWCRPRSARRCCGRSRPIPTLEITVDVERRTRQRPGRSASRSSSRSTTPPASGSSRASTTSASPCSPADAIDAYEARRPDWLPDHAPRAPDLGGRRSPPVSRSKVTDAAARRALRTAGEHRPSCRRRC